jgi:hypothetical protein
MLGANNKKYMLLFLTVLIVSIFYAALKESKEVKRDTTTLFNFYYKYKYTNPLKAKEALDLILQQEPSNKTATHAMINWYLQKGDTHAALQFLERIHQQAPSDAYIAYKLMKLYITLNEQAKAKIVLNQILMIKNNTLTHRATVTYETVYPEDKLVFVTTQYASFIEPIRFNIVRDFKPLYQQVQKFMKLQPDSARQTLQLILAIDKNALEAYLLLGYLELQEKHVNNALPNFVKAFELKPSPILALQLGYIYAELKNKTKAIEYFTYAANHGTDAAKSKSSSALNAVKRKLSIGILQMGGGFGISPVLSSEDKLWNLFYQNKKTNKEVAWRAIEKLLNIHPFNIRSLREAAYFATAEKNNLLAIAYWKRAYALERNPAYALSIGYLYDGIDWKYSAFHYFDLAAQTTNQDIHNKAEMAMTNMGGSQSKFFPRPYFAELYSSPFYFSRFNLGVFPTILRTGVTLNETYHAEPYFSYRRTSDSRSGTSLQGPIIQSGISQIFEDNVAIYAAGFRLYPWKKLPLQAFIETGKAEDLIDRNRSKWRGDVRAGLIYYNAFGETATYTDQLKLQFKYVSSLYADLIYYSRYNNNIIGSAWFRPGFRVATYQSASLDLYLANYYVIDKNKEFYNNLYSLGPGIAFRPTNRINCVLRFESLNGFYIPLNSKTPNPYQANYYNKLAMVELFFRF